MAADVLQQVLATSLPTVFMYDWLQPAAYVLLTTTLAILNFSPASTMPRPNFALLVAHSIHIVNCDMVS